MHEVESEAHKAAADLGGLFAGGSMDMMMTMGMIGAAMNGVPKGVQIDPSKAPGMSFSPGWYGTPEQALAGIEAIHSVVGMGRVGVHRRRHAEDAARGGGRSRSADGRDDGSGTARRSLLVGGRLMAGEKLVEKSVEADGFTIRYWEEGEGDPVVVLHGAGGPVPSVALDLLSAQNRILLFELPGWGDQPNDRSQSLSDLGNTVVAAMDALGLDARTSWARRLVVPLRCTSRSTIPSGSSSMVLESPAAFRVGSVPPPSLSPEQMMKAFRRHPDREPRGRAPIPSGWVVHGRSSSGCSWRRLSTTKR